MKPRQHTTIFTIGHSNRSQEDFIAILRKYEIKRLIDIRSIPKSRHNPQFNSDKLGPYLRNRKISYRHMLKLGGLRSTQKNSINNGWRNKSFRGYADYMQTDAFNDGLNALIKLAQSKLTVIMCAEVLPWRCHRSLVADALIVRKFKVVDIMNITSAREHKLNPMAKVQKDKIVYPVT